MRSFPSLRALCLVTTSFAALSAAGADAATITGTVTGPDGAPFRGAFVQARNATTKITVSVLSDTQGHYQVPHLTAGDYRLAIRAPGYKSDPKTGIKLTADQSASYDFGLQPGLVRWSDISYVQGAKLLPDVRGKELFFTHCTACHGFEFRMAAVKRDADGWRDRVAYMRDAMGFFINRPQLQFTDQKADDVVYFLNYAFGEDSTMPSSPAEPAGLQGDCAPVQRRCAQDRLCGIRDARSEPDALECATRTRTASSGFPITGAPTRSAELDPDDRRGDRIPGAQSRHRRDPFGGAGAGRQRSG